VLHYEGESGRGGKTQRLSALDRIELFGLFTP